MTRELGEKSYNPGVFRMDAWTNGSNMCYWKLFERKLPGNIVLATYQAPLTMRELSVELGVSVPYLEDEVAVLLEHEMLVQQGDKYRTNIVILTQDCERQVADASRAVCERVAGEIAPMLAEALPRLQSLNFYGNDYGDRRLMWTLTNLAMIHGMEKADAAQRKAFGEYPVLSNGVHGYIYGFDHQRRDHPFNGIYGHTGIDGDPDYFSVVNYRIIESCQKWKPQNWDKSIAAMLAAMRGEVADLSNDMLVRLIEEGFIHSCDGQLSAAFPVFTQQMAHETLPELLAPLSEKIAACLLEACAGAGEIAKRYAPKVLHGMCEQVAAITYRMGAMARVVESLVVRGDLVVPESDEKLCVYGVVG